jgi:hypothetical protein
MATYDYSIYNDFPNHKVAPGRLKQEIEEKPEITVALDVPAITTLADVCSIHFKADLDASQQTALDQVVAAHGGEPLEPEEDPQWVKIDDCDDIPWAQARTKVIGIAFDVPAGEWYNHDFSFPYKVNMLSGGGEAGFSKDGDIFEFVIMPDTTIGALTAGGTIPADGTAVLSASPTVLENIGIGYWAKFEANPANFPNSPEFLVLDYDEAAGTITVQGNGTEKAVSAADFVAMSIKYAENCEVQPGEYIDIGGQASGAASVPANTPLRLRYKNTDVAAIRVKLRLVMKYQPRK